MILITFTSSPEHYCGSEVEKELNGFDDGEPHSVRYFDDDWLPEVLKIPILHVVSSLIVANPVFLCPPSVSGL